MISLRIEPDFKGPTLPEMASLLDDVTEAPIEVRWENSRLDIEAIHKLNPRFHVVLVVADMPTMSRSASALGIPMVIGEDLLTTVRGSLNQSEGNWRQISASISSQVSRDAVLRIAGNSVRKGLNPVLLRRVAMDFALNKANSTDAEVLLGLARMAAR